AGAGVSAGAAPEGVGALAGAFSAVVCVLPATSGLLVKFRTTAKIRYTTNTMIVKIVRASPVLVPKAVCPDPAPLPKAPANPPPWGFWMSTVSTMSRHTARNPTITSPCQMLVQLKFSAARNMETLSRPYRRRRASLGREPAKRDVLRVRSLGYSPLSEPVGFG